MNQAVTDCFEIEWKNISDSTSTVGTPITTTSSMENTTITTTTTTTTTSTSSITIITITTTVSNGKNDYYAIADEFKQSLEYMIQISNATQRIYLLLSMAYMALTVLHCVYFFKLIKTMLIR